MPQGWPTGKACARVGGNVRAVGDLIDDLAVTDVAAVVARIVTALRTMSPGKLAETLPGPTASRADAGRLLARALALAAQGVEAAGEARAPSWRALPEVGDLVVGDQLNVVWHDLRRALGVLGDVVDPAAEPGPAAARGSRAPGVAAVMVWTTDGRAPLVDVLRDVAATAEEVRRLL